MDESLILAGFFARSARDPRISVTHIGLFTALLRYRQEAGRDPFPAYSQDIMRLAKLSSRTTYFKVINELHDYGYLRYERSFKPHRASRICLKEERDECGDTDQG